LKKKEKKIFFQDICCIYFCLLSFVNHSRLAVVEILTFQFLLFLLTTLTPREPAAFCDLHKRTGNSRKNRVGFYSWHEATSFLHNLIDLSFQRLKVILFIFALYLFNICSGRKFKFTILAEKKSPLLNIVNLLFVAKCQCHGKNANLEGKSNVRFGVLNS